MKIDKSISKIIRSSKDWEEQDSYWANKSPQERLAAIEYLREQYIKGLNLMTKIDKSVFEIHYGK